MFIGKGLVEDEIRQAFFECECDEELRFELGQTVMALAGNPNDEGGGWLEGKVIQQWDQGNAYRIELSKEGGGDVWAPVNTNDYVRKL